MYKFYYYENTNYYDPAGGEEEVHCIMKALFVERKGNYRVGTVIIPSAYAKEIEWVWKPDFNGKFTPLATARQKQVFPKKKKKVAVAEVAHAHGIWGQENVAAPAANVAQGVVGEQPFAFHGGGGGNNILGNIAGGGGGKSMRRCVQDSWFDAATEVGKSELKRLKIVFDEKSFD